MGYVAIFDRISRDHNVAPLAVAGDADAIAEQIWNYARPKCASRDISVTLDLDALKGYVFAGFHVAGEFTLEETS